jgi:hypothetical protein
MSRQPIIIKVPDIEGPVEQLCWKQAPDMRRCDRRKGHGGLHVWQMIPKQPTSAVLAPGDIE